MQRCLLYLFALVSLHKVYSQECITLTGMKLCTTPTCPDDYHICNIYDKSLITRNHRVGEFAELRNTYSTQLTQYGDECKYNRDELRYSISNTEPSDIKSEYCNFDNTLVEYGEGMRIGECVFCFCEPDRSRCINMCEYASSTYIVNDYRNVKSFSPKYRRSIDSIQNCASEEQIKNVACCKNSHCSMKHCISCESYGTRESCVECQANAFFYRGFKTKCYTLNEIEVLCNKHYSVDYDTQHFTCLTCDEGTLVVDERTNTTSCECAEGYFGPTCSKNYNRLFCSSNGIYDATQRECVCNDGFGGENCEKSTMYECVHGVFDRSLEGCICNKGFYGTHCEHEVLCYHGHIVDRVCMCDEGFSGDSCDIFIKETDYEREKKELLLRDYHTKDCKQGSYDNITKTCTCVRGFTGSDCSIELCKYGSYNYRDETCTCQDGYYGNTCEKSCISECNYNGNICNSDRVCVCDNGWYGDTCAFVRLDTERITIASTFTMNISIVDSESKEVDVEDGRNNDMQIEVISCYTHNCVPFKLSRSYNSTTRGRYLNEEQRESESFVEISFSQTIVNRTANESVYVYPNNNASLSYYGGENVLLVNMDIATDNYFYIESRSQYSTITSDDNDIIVITDDATSTDNDDGSQTGSNEPSSGTDEQMNNDSSHTTSFLDKVTNNTVFIISGFGGLLVAIVVIRTLRNGKRRRKNIVQKKIDENQIVFTSNSLYNSRMNRSFQPSNRKLVSTSKINQQV